LLDYSYSHEAGKPVAVDAAVAVDIAVVDIAADADTVEHYP
jgi:hypothetical protein